MDGKERILELLKIPKKNIDLCGDIYAILKQETDQSAQLLQFFCENAIAVSFENDVEPSKLFTDGELLDFTEHYGMMIKGILKDIFLEKPSKEEFYSKLWEKITLNELFSGEKAQIFALYYAWMDKRLPYFELSDTIHMDAEEYREIIGRLLDKEQKAQFILASGFKQWTEVSYLLLELLDEVTEKKEKAVLLSCIFQIREKMLIRKLMSQNSEIE